MSKNVTVSSISTHLPEAGSYTNYSEIIKKEKEYWNEELDLVFLHSPDIIVLPEKCDRPRGLSVNECMDYYLERGETMLEYFKEKARNNRCYITYSASRQMPDETWRNSTQLIDRSGKIAGIYDKNYPTIGEIDLQKILPGDKTELIECDFGNVACAICFDIIFEEQRKKYEALKPELILYSSMMHGGHLANYWAYSSRSYFVGALGMGQQGYIISPLGKTIALGNDHVNNISEVINLDYKVIHLDYNMEKLMAMKKKYGEKVKIEDPGFQGSVLVTSETDELTAEDMVREFEIEKLDDYIARSMHHQEYALSR